jgi:hypothetical protein
LKKGRGLNARGPIPSGLDRSRCALPEAIYQQTVRQLFQPRPGGSQVVVQLRVCACTAVPAIAVSVRTVSKIFSMFHHSQFRLQDNASKPLRQQCDSRQIT